MSQLLSGGLSNQRVNLFQEEANQGRLPPTSLAGHLAAQRRDPQKIITKLDQGTASILQPAPHFLRG